MAIFVTIVLCITGCGYEIERQEYKGETQGQLTVHYIDVGQGDATLLQGPDFTVLIDAGRHDQDQVAPYLAQVGVTHIDLLIGTHPHADHIGQMAKVIEYFPVHEVWMCGNSTTSRTYEKVLDAILASDANYHEPRTGEQYQIGSLDITVLHPNESQGNLNDDSISTLINYGQMAFVFTGDAEKNAEEAMLQSNTNLNATFLKLGHHGSSTSSTPAFLNAVQPKVAIYSAGAGNSYGHPHQEVIERVSEMNIEIYGTDINGTIRITTDGQEYSIETDH